MNLRSRIKTTVKGLWMDKLNLTCDTKKSVYEKTAACEGYTKVTVQDNITAILIVVHTKGSELMLINDYTARASTARASKRQSPDGGGGGGHAQ